MIALREVEARLAKIGFTNRYWGHAEVRELQHILMPEEEVVCAVNGRYENGFALLLATDRRLLLVDKKPLFLNMEDLRFDMISEVDYYSHVLEATVCVRTINTPLTFTSWRQRRLRQLTAFMQNKVMELRQHGQAWQNQALQNLQPQQTPQNQSLLGTQPLYEQAQQPAQPQKTTQFSDYPAPLQPSQPQQPMANPAALATDPQRGFRQMGPYPAAPLTIRRRVGRFYPSVGK